MTLSDLCIKRPVFATVLSLFIILIGVVSFNRLTVREYPDIEVPVVNVDTFYRGANAQIMETQVTNILEDSISGVEGVDYMQSTSRSQTSQITITFDLDMNPDDAAANVRDRVSRIRSDLPQDIEDPVITKVEADAEPIMYMALTSNTHAPADITDYADRIIVDQLQVLDGVSQVRIFGQRRYAMRVDLDRQLLAAYNLTTQDVEQAIRTQNLEVPAGRIESTAREFSVLAETDLINPEEFRDIVLRQTPDGLIRLSDVARVDIGVEDERTFVRYKQENAVALGVVKQSTANPLSVAQLVKQELPRIRDNLPDGMELNIGYDRSVFIDRSIESVYSTLFQAVALVVAIIYLFLGSWRATLIPMLTIPISLIAAFGAMAALGFSVNTLTLLALVLAIGLVVDDAIVVLENIERHIEMGKSSIQAAFDGMEEITFAVIATTLSLISVFVPMAFATGRTGNLFTEFALTVAGAVAFSTFIALTLTPMMCSRLLKPDADRSANKLTKWFEEKIDWAEDRYRSSLDWSLTRKWIIILPSLAVAGLMAVLFITIPSELAPTEDRGVFVGFGIGPQGATPEYIDKYARQMEQIYADLDQAKAFFVVAGVPTSTQAISYVPLKDWSKRKLPQQAISGMIMPKMMQIEGIMAFTINPPSLGQSPTARPVQYVLQTTGTYDDLGVVVDRMMTAARESGLFVNPRDNLELNQPELTVFLDREKVADLGLDVAEVGATIQTLIGGREVTDFKRLGEEYEVIVQMKDQSRNDPGDLSEIFVRTDTGEMIQLGAVVDITETVAPSELLHFDKLRSATIQGDLAEGVTQGDALAFLDGKLDEIRDDYPNTRSDATGPLREYIKAGAAVLFAFGLALMFIYLVLAAQFESFVDPLMIMLSVPLALFGALSMVWLSGNTLNIYSQVGMLALIGIVTKHGILMVEFANQIMDKQGKQVAEAIKEASIIRLRPILMTTFSTVFSAIPLALASGAGAESRRQIGLVIIGGMIIGTLFTLYVIPMVYTWLGGKDIFKKVDDSGGGDRQKPAPALPNN